VALDNAHITGSMVQLKGHRFNSHHCTSVRKQYNLVLTQKPDR